MQDDPFKYFATSEDINYPVRNAKYFKPKTGGLIPHERFEEIIKELNLVSYSSQISYDELMKALETLRSMPPVLPPKVSFADLMKAQEDFLKSQKIRYSSDFKYTVPTHESLWEEGWYNKLFLNSYGLPMIPVDSFPLM